MKVKKKIPPELNDLIKHINMDADPKILEQKTILLRGYGEEFIKALSTLHRLLIKSSIKNADDIDKFVVALNADLSNWVDYMSI